MCFAETHYLFSYFVQLNFNSIERMLMLTVRGTFNKIAVSGNENHKENQNTKICRPKMKIITIKSPLQVIGSVLY